MIWTIDLDDFNNICYKEKYPMTKIIGKTLMRMNRKKCSPLTPIVDEGRLNAVFFMHMLKIFIFCFFI